VGEAVINSTSAVTVRIDLILEEPRIDKTEAKTESSAEGSRNHAY